MSEKLENKNKRKEGLTWGSPLCSPAAAGRPSQQAAQPTWAPSSVIFLPDKRTGACPTGAPPRRATSSLPACLSSPRRSGWTGRRHATPRTSLPLSHSSPSPGSLSPSHTRAPSLPPLAVAVATGLPSPPRHAQELRSSALKLPVKPCPSGCPVEPPPSSFPSPAAVDPHRRSGRFSASPSPLRLPLQPR